MDDRPVEVSTVTAGGRESESRPERCWEEKRWMVHVRSGRVV